MSTKKPGSAGSVWLLTKQRASHDAHIVLILIKPLRAFFVDREKTNGLPVMEQGSQALIVERNQFLKAQKDDKRECS